MHRDLKMDNIVVSVDNNKHIYDLKIADFGIACCIKDNYNKEQKSIGSFGYMAPELYHRNHLYDEKIDVYCLGVILFILACNDMPYKGKHYFEIK